MKYSIIIPYRNREAHLQVLLPTLLNKFSGEEFEIIISEQNDNDNFRIACVQNVAYNYAKGEILIFHQVDYVPSDNVSYEVHDVPVLPAHRGIFLNEDNESLRDINDIPAGYRMWSDEIDPNFYVTNSDLQLQMYTAADWYNTYGLGIGMVEMDFEDNNPRCVNPKHLVNGTIQENNLDKLRKGRQYKKYI